MAAVASRNANNSPHLSTMSSPKDAKKVKSEDSANSVQPTSQATSDIDSKPATTANGESKPLGPPPKPSDGGDYFSTAHGTNGTQYGAEPNPFEAQFGNPSAETPGWPSLRSGPLSPAMLTGPTGAQDYFDPSFSRGFPTPNESGLRTGLTPGGGGSMFPAPSPNSQALFNSLQSGGATPSTLDFYRTSLGAKAASQSGSFNPPTSQPTDPQLQNSMDRSQQPNQQDPFTQQHGDADAVNGLYMLAQASNGANGVRNNQYPVQNAQAQTSMSAQAGSTASASPATRRAAKNSITSNETNEVSEEESEQDKRATRSRGKKAANTKSTPANNRRKAEDAPAKAPANKRSKGNNGAAQEADDREDDEEEMSPPAAENNTKKMTDEEKRKNFLERNRVAALKCRQRKKQWLANLQAKVELFSTENDALSQTVTQLREELVNLKTLLLAHKDCPVSVQQGIAGPAMAMYLGADSGNHHANPYGIGMQPNGLPQGMQMPMQQTGPGGQGVSRG
ncbi:hypothetical protein, variant 3 [Verruconis gallopava]|uniref:BZIP domain-containing protein n=1 Tax=Verruconis gallopava TaxID=253628 RepID=A0A0D2A616_9PEZI|nr:hypothetical protein, variant 3 [Verruconis gallopava]KIW02183.1 hypothetical protein, variant 3 [Verruconis gallopava]